MRQPPSSVRGLLRIGLTLSLLTAAVTGSAPRAAAQTAPAQRWDGFFEVLSAPSSYAPPPPGPPEVASGTSRSSRHAVSGDGRYVVFDSDAPNLAPFPALYLRDRRTGELQLLVPNARAGAISADGVHVAFEICDSFLRPEPSPICDVGAIDRRTWSWATLSTTAGGTFADADSGAPVLSADGRFAAFVTAAANLTGGTPGTRQIVLRDRDADGNGVYDEPGGVTLETISVGGASGIEAGDADSETPALSDDGRFVAFRSRAANLVAGGTSGGWNAFLRDRQSGETRQLNVSVFGQQSEVSLDEPQISISADGRYVAFASADGSLLTTTHADDTNGTLDVYVYDRESQALSRVDVGRVPGGATVLGNGPTGWPTLSADGRYVSVQSAATNVGGPPTGGAVQVYVVDRTLGEATRISIAPDGTTPDQPSLWPGLSADASVVVFWSSATSYAGIAPPIAKQFHAAAHLGIAPATVVVPGGGGEATFTITAQAHTAWWATWMEPWVGMMGATWGTGDGDLRLNVPHPNPDSTPRSAVIRVGTATATLTQDPGLSMGSLSPSSGPVSGGTVVTIHGTGFQPGMFVHFGPQMATDVQVLDSTTLAVTVPPGERPGPVMVGMWTADGQIAYQFDAFVYLDVTPPFLFGTTAGPMGQNGWFTGDVTVSWLWWDDETPVTTTCATVVVTQDTAGTTYTCTATSEGGTTTASITVKRDATPPAIAISTPYARQVVEPGSVVPSAFTCSDAVSGVADCGLANPTGTPIDTTGSGARVFSAMAADAAGNIGIAPDVEYVVGTGVCLPPPAGAKAWLQFDGTLFDTLSTNGTATNGLPADSFVAGASGQAYRFLPRYTGTLHHYHYGRLHFSSAMTVAMWLKPGNNLLGELIDSPNQFRFERNSANGFTWWLFRPNGEPASFGWSSIGAPANVWSHVVLTFDAGTVTVFVNGRLDRTWTVPFTTLQTPPVSWNYVRIGGPSFGGNYPYVGALDELAFFDRALDPAEVEATYLAGASSMCAPVATVLEVPAITTTYGAGTYPGLAILRDANGLPLAGKTVTLTQAAVRSGVSSQTTTKVTDANGTVLWDAPFDVDAGTYAGGFRAHFAGDLQHAHSSFVSATVTVQKATPQITWATPAPITYGTALTYAGQLNATGSVPGSLSYNPGAGSVPAAGARTLTVTLSPTAWQNYASATASVVLDVRKAVPAMTVTGGTFTFNGTARAATATATDYRGLALTPVTITYNGSPDAPVDAGTYAVVATFAGDANHESRAVTTTLTISRATPTILFSTLTFTYDGQPHAVVATAHGVAGAVGTAAVTYGASPDAPAAAGVYTLTAAFDGNANYLPRTTTAILRINPTTPTLTIAGGPFTYDAQPHGVTVTATGVGGETPPGAVTVTYAGSTTPPVGAGTYAVSASIAAGGNYASASATGTLTIAKAAIALSVNGGTFVYDGQPHAASVTATGAGGAPVAPVIVTYDGGSAAPVAAGTYTVQASFAGSGNYEPASAAGTVVVTKAAPALSWNAPAAIVHGVPLSAVQLNATASVAGTFVYAPAAGTVLGAAPAQALTATFAPADASNYEAGTVSTTIAVQQAATTITVTGGTFTYDGQPHAASASATGVGGAPLTPVTVTYNGSSAVPVDAGSYEVVATFAGDANHAPASGNAALTIGKAPVTLSWSAPAAIGYGTPLSAAQLNATASVPGTFVYSPAAGAVPGAGAQGLTATFTPTDPANYAGGTAATVITVAPAPLVVAASDAAKTYGAALPAFTASFSGFVAGDSPASLGGALAFATAATSSSPVGTYAVTPVGLSSPNYAIAFASGTLTIVRAPVAVSLTASPGPSGIDMPISLTATVVAAQAAPTAPAGTVRFFDGPTLVGTATLVGSTATLVTGGLAAGSHTLEARYDGDASFDLGSGAATHVVNAAAATPAITITSSRQPASTGQSITLTATITVATSGTIQFYDGGTLVGSGSIASGRATFTTSSLAAGSHAITARFTGTASAPPVFSPVFVQRVNGGGWKDRSTTLTLVSSANPAALGTAVTFTATVSGSSGTPSGRILFMVNGAVVGDPAGVPVTTVSSSTSRATVSLPPLAGGRHKVTATYLGSSNYRGSAGALTQTVN